MKKRIAVFALLFCIITITSVFAGPFGIEFGMTKEIVLSNAILEKELVNGVLVVKPNIKSPLFDWYGITIAPSYGVVSIIAQGISIKTDFYGEKIKQEFEKVKKLISKAYGNPTSEYDFLRSNSIWNESNEWMKSLQKGERVYSCYWIKDKGALLPGLMESIKIDIKVSDSDETDSWIYLCYQSVNYSNGINEIQEIANENVF